MVTHLNLMSHCQMFIKNWDYDEDTFSLVTWLPPYHDMGLIGGIILPIGCLNKTYMMSPLTFIKDPSIWLKTITKYKATFTGGPNFSFQYCIEKVKEKSDIDLSSLKVFFTGAEPIQSLTLDSFYETFKECGYKRKMTYPCYGLAEATLYVTGSEIELEPIILSLDKNEFSNGKIILREEGENVKKIVSCGQCRQPVILWNKKKNSICDSLEIGEVWIENTNHTPLGYWNRKELTNQMFRATNGDGKYYFKTGDLGFMYQNELFICGRMKDLIIIRGRNIYPQDIESIMENVDSDLRKGCCCAFSVESTLNGEDLIVIIESKSNKKEIVEKIRREVSLIHQVDIFKVILIKPKTIEKTTSGKIRRSKMKELYLKNELKSIQLLVDELKSIPLLVDEEQKSSKESNHLDYVNMIKEKISSLLNMDIQQLDTKRPFTELGLDSMKSTLLIGELSEILKRDISPTLFFEFPTIDSLSHYLSDQEIQPKKSEIKKQEQDDIAVIAVSLRFPKCENEIEFWNLLKNGVDGISKDPPKNRNLKYPGGYISWDGFDHEFFEISKREELKMDPQQGIMLELVWELLENAGMKPNQLSATDTGVFIGNSHSDFQIQQYRESNGNVDLFQITGSALSIIANRISYFYNLKGPSMVLDSACSSSLLSIHEACQSIRSGECSLAISGGINLILSNDITDSLMKSTFLSKDFQCKTFDENANGYVRSEGAGLVLLKKLKDAIRDKDNIYSVIKSSAVVQDGKSNGLTSPNPSSQEALIHKAFQSIASGDYSVKDYQFIECHGTGTKLGDPIEVNTIQKVLGDHSCFIGR
jgi:3-oxoacyl-(acyl-carrier-protein) synthase/acyl carrier protein